MSFFEDMEKCLTEAIIIEKGDIPLTEKKNMPAPTFYAEEKEHKLIDAMVLLRKEQNISQKQIAELTGNKQQAISRIEQKENSPSLKSFIGIINSIGYDLQIVKSDT